MISRLIVDNMNPVNILYYIDINIKITRYDNYP